MEAALKVRISFYCYQSSCERKSSHVFSPHFSPQVCPNLMKQIVLVRDKSKKAESINA